MVWDGAGRRKVTEEWHPGWSSDSPVHVCAPTPTYVNNCIYTTLTDLSLYRIILKITMTKKYIYSWEVICEWPLSSVNLLMTLTLISLVQYIFIHNTDPSQERHSNIWSLCHLTTFPFGSKKKYKDHFMMHTFLHANFLSQRSHWLEEKVEPGPCTVYLFMFLLHKASFAPQRWPALDLTIFYHLALCFWPQFAATYV